MHIGIGERELSSFLDSDGSDAILFIFMQFLCLQNLPFNISKTGAFTKIERVTSCKVAGRF